MSAPWPLTEVDAAIAAELQPHLPGRLFDAHAHLYRTRDLGNMASPLTAQGPPVADVDAWRGALAPWLGGERLLGGLFIPFPTKTCDVDAANALVAVLVKADSTCRGLAIIHPGHTPEKAAAFVEQPGIVGFKPYHVFAQREQTFDATLDEYLPEWAWALAHERRLVITLHMVRSGALSDPQNQRDIRAMCSKYPNARLILAHAARGFHAPNTIRGLDAIEGLDNVWFDTSAICEPDALMAILKARGAARMMWGTDFPVCQNRGKCVTVGDAFSWVCPERIDTYATAPECHPTLVGLESLRALCLALDLMNASREEIESIFAQNTLELLGIENR